MNLNIPFTLLEDLKTLKDEEKRLLSYKDPSGAMVVFTAHLSKGQLQIVTQDKDVEKDKDEQQEDKQKQKKGPKKKVLKNLPAILARRKNKPKLTEAQKLGYDESFSQESDTRYPRRTRKVRSVLELFEEDGDDNENINDKGEDKSNVPAAKSVKKKRKSQSDAPSDKTIFETFAPLGGESMIEIHINATSTSHMSLPLPYEVGPGSTDCTNTTTPVKVHDFDGDNLTTTTDSGIEHENKEPKCDGNLTAQDPPIHVQYADETGVRRQKVKRLLESQAVLLEGSVDCNVYTDTGITELLDTVKPTMALDDFYTPVNAENPEPGQKKQIVCNKCGSIFDNKKSFIKHLKTHMEWKPWDCPKCDLKFEYRAQLARHIYAHGSVKPYQCRLCSKSFVYKQKLQLHMKYHYNKKDIMCMFCDAGFEERKLLHRHIERVHPKVAAHVIKKKGKRKSWVFKTNVIDDVDIDEEPTASVAPEGEEKHLKTIEEVWSIDDNAEVDANTEGAADGEADGEGAGEGAGNTDWSHGQDDDNDAANVVNKVQVLSIDEDDSYRKDIPQNSDDEANGHEENEDKSMEEVKEVVSDDKAATTAQVHIEMTTTSSSLLQKRRTFTACSEMPNGLSDYVIDEKDELSRRVLICKFCDAMAVTPALMVKHLAQEHRDIKPYKCTQCDFRSRHRSTMHIHSKTHSELKLHKCHMCEKSYKFNSSLRNHISSHKNTREFKCEACNSAFNHRYNLKAHIQRMHHSKLDDVCELCGKCFKTSRDLSRHLESHSKTRTHQCKYCEKKYKTRATLYMHTKSHTVHFYCSICDKNITSYSSFLLHKRSHEPDFKGYPCKICKHVFLSHGNLSNHMKVVHSTERPYPCDQCRQKFKTKSHLQRHQVVHSDEKNFKCPECGIHCKRQETLTKHMDTHRPVKPYICSQCNAQYTQQAALERHVEVKHGLTYHTCELCNEIFKARSYLQRHKRKVHRKTQEHQLEPEIDITVVTGVDDDQQPLVLDEENTYLVCDTCKQLFPTQQSLVVHVLTEHMAQKWVGGMGLMTPSQEELTVMRDNAGIQDQSEQLTLNIEHHDSDTNIGQVIEIENNIIEIGNTGIIEIETSQS